MATSQDGTGDGAPQCCWSRQSRGGGHLLQALLVGLPQSTQLLQTEPRPPCRAVASTAGAVSSGALARRHHLQPTQALCSSLERQQAPSRDGGGAAVVSAAGEGPGLGQAPFLFLPSGRLCPSCLWLAGPSSPQRQAPRRHTRSSTVYGGQAPCGLCREVKEGLAGQVLRRGIPGRTRRAMPKPPLACKFKQPRWACFLGGQGGRELPRVLLLSVSRATNSGGFLRNAAEIPELAELSSPPKDFQPRISCPREAPAVLPASCSSSDGAESFPALPRERAKPRGKAGVLFFLARQGLLGSARGRLGVPGWQPAGHGGRSSWAGSRLGRSGESLFTDEQQERGAGRDLPAPPRRPAGGGEGGESPPPFPTKQAQTDTASSQSWRSWQS